MDDGYGNEPRGIVAIDEEKLMGHVHHAVGDFGALVCAALINVGEKLGLFQAMAGSDPMTAAELAQRTGTTERYMREWANGLAAAGYLDYAGDGRYELNREQALVTVLGLRLPRAVDPARVGSSRQGGAVRPGHV
jgi:Rv2258c-like winged HTH domain